MKLGKNYGEILEKLLRKYRKHFALIKKKIDRNFATFSRHFFRRTYKKF